ncbi:hypothetical protein J6590_024132 [Homalodisca vitripennis]|nr:hypothetical protein J6590_024132 [Homalodisca vitripennis]
MRGAVCCNHDHPSQPMTTPHPSLSMTHQHRGDQPPVLSHSPLCCADMGGAWRVWGGRSERGEVITQPFLSHILRRR